MKKQLICIILFLPILISSCQEEIEEINLPPAEEAFTATSTVANLALRVAMNDGSGDNIISRSSCISFMLPVTVIVNGQQLVVNSEKDFKLVERIIDQYETDTDEVKVIFPVTIILADHSKVQINNEDELEEYMEDCKEGGLDDDIECIDFQYPLQFSLYNPQNQVINNITINNDQELFSFLDRIEDEVYVSLNFPVTLILSDGSEVKVFDNNQLESIIEDSEDDCDEDDDNDFDDDDVDDTELKSFLTTGKWKITSYIDRYKSSDAFEGIEFTFNENGHILASNGIETVEGEWETYGHTGKLEMELDFASVEPYKNLNEEWQIIGYSNVRLELEDTSGGADFTIVFEKL